jgi:predicted small secreted protein
MKLNKGIAIAIVLGLAVTGLTACEREGPMEKAGKKIDSAGEKVGESIEKAGEKLQDAARDAKK